MGVRVGLVAAAATGGAVVGLGLRRGGGLTPFALYGRSLFAALTGVLPQPVLAIVVGVGLHVLWMTVWGVCFTVVATPLRGARIAGAAILVSLLVGVVAIRVYPPALGAATMTSLAWPQLAVYLALLALSFLAGTRIAQ